MWTFLYRGAWTAARLAAPLLAAGGGKLARSIRGRRGATGALHAWASRSRDTSRPLVWFHAASVGEGRQAESVLVRLRAARPGWQIVFTHSSASAEALAASLPADFAGYVPADTRADTGRALDAVRPAALVFAATDLWPELVRQAAARNVPVGLISATLSPTSSRRGPFARTLLNGTYAALNGVGAIDQRDADGLAALGTRPDRITVTGDTRHDAAAARAAAVNRDAPALAALAGPTAPLLVAGSTWPSDEQMLLPAVAEVRNRTPLALIIAPHEPDAAHLTALERGIARYLPDARIARLSALESDRCEWDVCIVDRVGVLADLYARATIAYVGGGFHGAGLHSVIEPAALGVPVLFGPRWESSNDARLLQERGGAFSGRDAAALRIKLVEWLENPTARLAAGAAARRVVDDGIGAADRSLALVIRLVEEPRA